MRCFSCNHATSVTSGERIGFRDECTGCGADLHACANCLHHDPSAYNECRESSAERVGERDRANRCEYFAPGDDQTTRSAGSAGRAQSGPMADLETLFKKD
jgi:hypothetical protein